MSDNSEAQAERFLSKVLNREEAPFLKTCPVCNAPLRRGKRVAVVLKTIGGWNEANAFLSSYYCVDHAPDPGHDVEPLLSAQAAVFEVKLHGSVETLNWTVKSCDLADDRPQI